MGTETDDLRKKYRDLRKIAYSLGLGHLLDPNTPSHEVWDKRELGFQIRRLEESIEHIKQPVRGLPGDNHE